MLIQTLLAGTLLSTGALAYAGAGEGLDPTPRQIQFTRAIANIEIVSNELFPEGPKTARIAPPEASGSLWFGRIQRWLAKDPFPISAHDVVFAASYEGPDPVRLWHREPPAVLS